MNNRDLAILFLQKSSKETVVSDVLSFFAFDCLDRCFVDPEELDEKVRAFAASDYSDTDTLTALIDLIKSGTAESRRREEELLGTVCRFVNEHLTEDMTVEEIAAALHLSYYYLCHFFKQRTGKSLNTYRRQKRLERAFWQLRDTTDRITDVAAHCGFNNVSYFTETFTKEVGMAPLAFREKARTLCLHPFYDFDDIVTVLTMPQATLLAPTVSAPTPPFTKTVVYHPNEGARFVHESAVVAFHGVLYAAWYSCPKSELSGYTPICCKRSGDGGKTWGALETVAEDKSERILYCPPVFGIDGDRLYMFVNQMVAPDHIHSLDLYVLNEESGRFERLWTRPVPFKLNTNAIPLPNGKFLLPGRSGNLDGFPNTPAVLIADDGCLDGAWRLVNVAENGDLPRGKQLIHPEATVIRADGRLVMFCRNDQSHVPLVYLSEDNGEHWSAAAACDIPFVSSKIYGGTLSDGQHYLVTNTDKFNRSRLDVFFTDGAALRFSKRITLFNDEPAGVVWGACHYPAAWEEGGVCSSPPPKDTRNLPAGSPCLR